MKKKQWNISPNKFWTILLRLLEEFNWMSGMPSGQLLSRAGRTICWYLWDEWNRLNQNQNITCELRKNICVVLYNTQHIYIHETVGLIKTRADYVKYLLILNMSVKIGCECREVETVCQSHNIEQHQTKKTKKKKHSFVWKEEIMEKNWLDKGTLWCVCGVLFFSIMLLNNLNWIQSWSLG